MQFWANPVTSQTIQTWIIVGMERGLFLLIYPKGEHRRSLVLMPTSHPSAPHAPSTTWRPWYRPSLTSFAHPTWKRLHPSRAIRYRCPNRASRNSPLKNKVYCMVSIIYNNSFRGLIVNYTINNHFTSMPRVGWILHHLHGPYQGVWYPCSCVCLLIWIVDRVDLTAQDYTFLCAWSIWFPGPISRILDCLDSPVVLQWRRENYLMSKVGPTIV